MEETHHGVSGPEKIREAERLERHDDQSQPGGEEDEEDEEADDVSA